MALLSDLPLVEGFQSHCDTCEVLSADWMCRHSYHTVNRCSVSGCREDYVWKQTGLDRGREEGREGRKR